MSEPEIAAIPDDPRLDRRIHQLRAQYLGDAQVPRPEDLERLLRDLARYQSALETQKAAWERTQQQLEAYRDRYVDLYDFAPVGYVTLDEEAYVQEINLAGARILGREPAELIGYDFGNHLFPNDRPAFAEHLHRCCAKRRDVITEVGLVGREGQVITVQLRSMPIEAGSHEGAFCKTAITDITQRKQAEEAFRQSEERLRLALEASGTGWWRIDLGSGELTADDACKTLFGLPLTAQPTFNLFVERIVADDRPRAQQHLAQAQLRPGDYEGEYRTHWPDGSLRWVFIKGRACHEPTGAPGHMMGIAMDVTARKQAEQDLQEAKAAAEKANESKSRFLTMISHELRTPLGAVLGMIDLALDEALPAGARECLEVARGSADSLLGIVNEILDLSRIEAGAMACERVPFSLRQVVEDTIRALRVRADEKGLTLNAKIPADLPATVIGDPARLRQVLVNLLGNALKYTERGRIDVQVDIEEETPQAVGVRLSVSDTGIGIPPEIQSQVFAPFVQGGAPTAGNQAGTGLGLAIVSGLVAQMGGRIWLESQVGHGSTFYFTARYPKAKEPAPASASQPIKSPRDPGTQEQPLRHLRVLLAEDARAHQALVNRVLGKRGHSVATALSGQEAVDLLQGEDFDLILMDVQMPGMDGFEATASIRSLPDPRKSRVPIIAMTAHAMKGDEERCLVAGMNAYLTKPINIPEFVALVEGVAGQSSP